MNGQADGEVDYKRKYKNLKRKLKFLIYEQECFQEELRRAQRKLLKVSQDKSFLLDRILQYENVDDDSSDSDLTASSENSDTEGAHGLSTPPVKRKRSPPPSSASPPPTSCSSGLSLHPAGGSYLSAMSPTPYTPFPSEYLAPLPNSTPPKSERAKRDRKNRGVKPKKSKISLGSPTSCGGVLPFSPRSSSLPSLSSSKHTPPPPILSTVPQQMFSDGGEGSGDDGPDGDEEDDLVIDIPE